MASLTSKRPFAERPEAVAALREQVRACQPTLVVRVRDGRVVIAGTFRILHEGCEIDSYKIEVLLADAHPDDLPSVYETGERILRSPTHHTYDKGRLCLGVPEELHIEGGAHDINAFLEGPVRRFLLGHSYFEQERRWPGGEWAHGSSGVRQFYEALTASPDRRVASRVVDAALDLGEANDFDASCLCGRPLPVRVCHGPVIQVRFFVPAAVLERTRAELDA